MTMTAASSSIATALHPESPPSSSTSLLTTLLLKLGQGHDPDQAEEEEEEEDEEAASPLSIEQRPATTFDAAAYEDHAADYYTQPLLLTGVEPNVARWPKLPEEEGGSRSTDADAAARGLLGNALASCRVCRITVPPLWAAQEEGRPPRLAPLQATDIQVEDVSEHPRGPQDVLDGLLQQPQQQEDEEDKAAAARVRTMVYAYGPLDVSSLHAGQPPPHAPTSFWAAFAPPSCLGTTRIAAANLWVGQNLTSRLHVDGLDNLLCVSKGSKIVHLYSPWQLAELDPHPPGSRPPPVESRWQSRLFHSPAAWPPGLHAHAIAHVQEGQCLFIPAGWFHEVFTPTATTLAISFWCASPTPEVAARVRLRPSLLHLAAASATAAAATGGDGDGDGAPPYQAFLEEQQRKKRCTRPNEETEQEEEKE